MRVCVLCAQKRNECAREQKMELDHWQRATTRAHENKHTYVSYLRRPHKVNGRRVGHALATVGQQQVQRNSKLTEFTLKGCTRARV